MTDVLTLQLLGAARVECGRAIELPTRRALGVLAALALEPDTVRGTLAGLFWSERPDAEARRNLRQELHRLNQIGVGAWIEASGERLRLRDSAIVDVRAFRARLAAADPAGAVDLYRGPLLQGFDDKGMPVFAEWLAVRREDLARRWRRALAQVAEQREAAGDIDAALELVRLLLVEEPVQEQHHRAAMRLLHLRGDRAGALVQFERCSALLREELALEPLPETAALARRIQTAPAAAAPAAAVPPPMQAPLVGRERAWRALEAAQGSLALIEGEPGVGKSRLAADFAASFGPLVVLKGREISRATPLYAVADALLDAYRRDTAWFERLDPVWRAEVARLVPSLAGDEKADDLPFVEARGRFLDGLAAALIGAAAGGTLLFDDLQWFDAGSAELVAHVVRRAHRVRLLATARPDELADNAPSLAALEALERDAQLVRIALAPLAEADVLALVRALSGSRGAAAFSHRLHAATAGNPLFILETLRDLFGAGVLWRDGTTWATRYDEDTEDYRELPLSRSVREAVLRRIDRLGESARRLLDAASVAGERFAPEWLGACTALSEWEVVQAVERVALSNLIQPVPEGYRFAHDLVRRSLDDALSPARRKLLQRRLAAQKAAANAPPDEVARLLEGGGRAAEAVHYRIKAGQAAASVYALREALAQYDLALADGPDERMAFKAHSARVELLRNLDDRAGCAQALAVMQELAEALDAPELQLEWAIKCTKHLFETGGFAQALQTAEQALARLAGRIDELAEAGLLLEMGPPLRALNRVADAEARLRVAMERFRVRVPMRYGNCAFWLSVCAMERGALDEAEQLAETALAIAAATGARRGHALTVWALAIIAFRRADAARFVALMNQALGEAREIGSVSLQCELLEDGTGRTLPPEFEATRADWQKSLAALRG
jgi:DNA-binding SARP family transcriptional activator